MWDVDSYNKTSEIDQFLKFIFGVKLHVSDSFSAHHQVFSTVHAAVVYVTQFLLTAC